MVDWKALSTTEYTEEEQRCAVVMALTNTRGKATDREVSHILGVQIHLVESVREQLSSGGMPRDVISSAGNIQEQNEPEQHYTAAQKVFGNSLLAEKIVRYLDPQDYYNAVQVALSPFLLNLIWFI